MEDIASSLISNYDKIIIANLSFIGTILAIILAFLTLPVQNLIGKYSSDFAKRIQYDRIFRASILYLAITFSYSLVLLGLPQHILRIIVSFILGIIAVIVLLNLIRRSFYLLDVRNHVKEIVNKINVQTRQKFKKAEQEIRERLKMVNVSNTDEKFEVSPLITEWLKNEMEIVFDVARIAVHENRFEIVESVMKNVIGIVHEYIVLRKDYSIEYDIFLVYIQERIIEIDNITSRESHDRIMASLVHCLYRISESSLIIKPAHANQGINTIATGFVDIMERILSKEVEKETSTTPSRICDHLIDIAKKSIDAGFPETMLSIIEKLQNISIQMTVQYGVVGDYISTKANWGLAYVLNYSIINVQKIKIGRDRVLKKISALIAEYIKFYFEDSNRTFNRSNLQPFAGATAEHGLAVLCNNAVQIMIAENSVGFHVITTLFNGIREGIIAGLAKQKHLEISRILDHVYWISLKIIEYIPTIENEECKNRLLVFIEKDVFNIFLNSIKRTFDFRVDCQPQYDKYLHAGFSILGILLISNKIPNSHDIVEIWLQKVVEIIDEKKPYIYTVQDRDKIYNYSIIHPLSSIYKYLRLAETWLLKYNPDSSMYQAVLGKLKAPPEKIFEPGEFAYESNGIKVKLYPSGLLGSTWSVKTPIYVYRLDIFNEYTRKLVDLDSMRQVEQQLKIW